MKHSESGIRSPDDALLSEKLPGTLLHRNVLRETNLAKVERLELDTECGRQTLILKSVVPDLAQELHATATAGEYSISAARYVESGLSPVPWLVVEDYGDIQPETFPDPSEIEVSLHLLADMHAGLVNSSLITRLPDRSVDWLLSEECGLREIFGRLAREYDLDIPESDLDAFEDRLRAVQAGLEAIPKTMIHGDFDPGNLVRIDDRLRAFDWGLSHVNVPVVDVAHMVFRYEPSIAERLIHNYAQCLGQLGVDLGGVADLVELVRAGDIAHQAFFVWWHSHSVLELHGDWTILGPTIRQRLSTISSS